VLGNLGDALEYLACDRAGAVIHARPLRPGRIAQLLLDWLLPRSLGGEVRRALAQQPELMRSAELAQREQVLSPQKVEAWSRQLRWLSWREDEAGLAALARRLRALPPLDNRQMAEDRRKWEAGARDGEQGKRMPHVQKQAEMCPDQARQYRQTPTLAAAWCW
jgi:hypothetical protein